MQVVDLLGQRKGQMLEMDQATGTGATQRVKYRIPTRGLLVNSDVPLPSLPHLPLRHVCCLPPDSSHLLACLQAWVGPDSMIHNYSSHPPGGGMISCVSSLSTRLAVRCKPAGWAIDTLSNALQRISDDILVVCLKHPSNLIKWPRELSKTKLDRQL